MMEKMDVINAASAQEIPKTENKRRRLKLKRTNSICKAPLDVWDYWDVSPHEVKVDTSKSLLSNTQSKNIASTYNGIKLKKFKKKKLNDSSTPRDPMLIESPTMEPGQDPNDKNEHENENEDENDRDTEKIMDERHKIEDENIQNIELNTTNQDNDNHNENDSFHLNTNLTSDSNVEIQEQNVEIIELNNNDKNNENINEFKEELIKNTSIPKVNWKKISVYVGTTVSIIGGAYVCYQTIGYGYVQHISKWFKRNK